MSRQATAGSFRKVMNIFFSLGGVPFCAVSERSLNTGSTFAAFLSKKEFPDAVQVQFDWDWSKAELPDVPMAGSDLLLDYYIDGCRRYCLCDGQAGPQSCVSYTDDCKTLSCVLNVNAFPGILPDLSLLIRYLPMREVLLKENVIFLHASQIALGDKGIVFAAPSGIGKTTQARLWQQYQGANIVCNDRTLVRKTPSGWCTYGYPFDGSEPISSNEVHMLGAVVLLEQAQEINICHLKAAKALALLMGQMVIDTWNPEARSKAIELLATLLDEVPVYLLQCRPDAGAVESLKRQLRKDGVI